MDTKTELKPGQFVVNADGSVSGRNPLGVFMEGEPFSHHSERVAFFNSQVGGSYIDWLTNEGFTRIYPEVGNPIAEAPKAVSRTPTLDKLERSVHRAPADPEAAQKARDIRPLTKAESEYALWAALKQDRDELRARVALRGKPDHPHPANANLLRF